VFFDQVLAPVRHLSSMPETLGTPGELIGVLRNVLVDSGAHPGLRHMAARRLAEMSHHDVFHGADPAQWWKGVSLVSGEPPQQAPVVVSASSLETLFECPRRWYVTQRLGARRPVVSLTMGSLIHDLLQETSWTHQQRLDALHDRWGELDHLAPWQDAHHREAAQRILERYDLWAARNSRTVLATEVSVELVQESSPLVVKGRIDRVDVDEAGQLWVIDYKTGSTFSRYTAKKAASNIQLGVYQLALEAGGIPGLVQPGHTRGGAELIGLGCDESSSSSMPKILGQAPLSTPPHLSEEISLGVLKAGLVDVGDQYQHRTWVDHRLTIVQSIISSGQYHALGGHHCLFCPVKNGCPTTLGGGLP
jgi:CRISPR/Cas system-associated exonuclease Cas4 (RecB family)